jgi:hypothetical protein
MQMWMELLEMFLEKASAIKSGKSFAGFATNLFKNYINWHGIVG